MSRKSQSVVGGESGAGRAAQGAAESQGAATEPLGSHPNGDGIFIRGIVIGRGRKMQPVRNGGAGEADELVTYVISVEGRRVQVSTYNPKNHLNIGDAIEEKVEIRCYVARGGQPQYALRFGSDPNIGLAF